MVYGGDGYGGLDGVWGGGDGYEEVRLKRKTYDCPESENCSNPYVLGAKLKVRRIVPIGVPLESPTISQCAMSRCTRKHTMPCPEKLANTVVNGDSQLCLRGFRGFLWCVRGVCGVYVRKHEVEGPTKLKVLRS